MKIVVTADGETLDAPVDQRFGRAAKFIVYDSVTKDLQVVDNSQSLDAAQGAGIQAAETISRLGAECLLTGHCGPKAFRALSAAGIRVLLEVPEDRRVAEAYSRGRAAVETVPGYRLLFQRLWNDIQEAADPRRAAGRVAYADA